MVGAAAADVAVPAAVLPAAARRARRDLRQHFRCVFFFSGSVLGNYDILLGSVWEGKPACLLALELDLFVGGFLEVTRRMGKILFMVCVERFFSAEILA